VGRKSREKGADFEREVVAAFKAAGIHAERRAPLQANAAIGEADVIAEGVGRIECKRRARGFGLVYAALENGDAVVIRDDQRAALIVLELADFLSRDGVR
jgi:hypothetical protein